MLPQRRHYLGHLAVRLLALLPGALLIQSGACHAAQITWTNSAGGDWNDAVNWSPNQVPGTGDSASITNPGTYTVALNADGAVGRLVLGGAGSGAQTLQLSVFTLTAGSASINGGGVLALNNATLKGAIGVASGGLLRCYLGTLSAAVTIQSGGRLLLSAQSLVGDSDSSLNTNDWLWVQSGGELDAGPNAGLYVYTPMTNAGLANFTNSGITLYNNGTRGYSGGLWNQAGGVVNLVSGAGLSGFMGAKYLVNRGTINALNGNSSISAVGFTNLGTAATLPGTGILRIGPLNGLGTLTGKYDAGAGTVIQFVAGDNPGTSPGTPLVLGGAGQCQFVMGTLTLPSDVVPGLVMTNGNLILGPGFQGGAITNLVLSGMTLVNNLPISGTMVMTNGILVTTNTLASTAVLSLNGVTMYGALNVAAGGLLSCSGSTLLRAQVTVQNGGEFLLSGPTTVGQGWLWVKTGGELDASSNATLSVQTTLTNAGLASFTHDGINTIYPGGVWNQTDGVLNLISGAGMSGSNAPGYLVNQGTINVSNGNSTINMFALTNLGTVATLPGAGTLRIGIFNGLGSLTGTFNAAAGTSIQFVGGNFPGTSAGTPLVLAGAGQCQFVSGTLTLTADVIPGLMITGGTLRLGPGFQGGAITNLGLNGISLTNNLPIRGILAMTNGTLVTTNTLTNPAVLALDGMTMYGRLNLGAGGLLSCSHLTQLGAQVSIQSGGRFLLWGPTTIGQPGLSANTNDWLSVQSGGELDAAYTALLYLYTSMTNAGFANFTNYGITLYNSGASGYRGRLWNQPGGVLNLISTAGIAGGFGADYVVNQGTLNCVSPSATSLINVNNFTNVGTLNALYGTLRLQIPHLVLAPSGTLGVGLSSPTAHGIIDIPGTAALRGAFAATLNNGFVPQLGTSFNVVTYSSLSGAFNNTNFQSIAPAPALPGLQHAISWTTTYSNTFMTITAQQITDQFVFAGTNGPPGHQYVVLSSTNLALPRTAWFPVATNNFDNNGNFIFPTDVDPATRQQFFTYRYQ